MDAAIVEAKERINVLGLRVWWGPPAALKPWGTLRDKGAGKEVATAHTLAYPALGIWGSRWLELCSAVHQLGPRGTCLFLQTLTEVESSIS